MTRCHPAATKCPDSVREGRVSLGGLCCCQARIYSPGTNGNCSVGKLSQADGRHGGARAGVVERIVDTNEVGGPVVKTMDRTLKLTVERGFETKVSAKSAASSAGILSACAVAIAGTYEEMTVNSHRQPRHASRRGLDGAGDWAVTACELQCEHDPPVRRPTAGSGLEGGLTPGQWKPTPGVNAHGVPFAQRHEPDVPKQADAESINARRISVGRRISLLSTRPSMPLRGTLSHENALLPQSWRVPSGWGRGIFTPASATMFISNSQYG